MAGLPLLPMPQNGAFRVPEHLRALATTPIETRMHREFTWVTLFRAQRRAGPDLSCAPRYSPEQTFACTAYKRLATP